jgi:integrase
VVDHLEPLRGFQPQVFRWPHDERTPWAEFGRMQRVAGSHLVCRENHEHTDACHVYGFHALRRACATMNAARMTGDALQALMQHRSYLTTQRYIDMASSNSRRREKPRKMGGCEVVSS